MKNRQGFIGILVAIIFGLAILGGAGYAVFHHQKTQEASISLGTDSTLNDSESNPITNSTTTIQANVSTDQPSTPNITSGNGWKKYTNSNFGYAFYYPDTWKVSTTNTGVTITNFGPTRNDPSQDGMSIREVQGSQAKVDDAKFGYTILSFDTGSNQWVENSQSESDGSNQAKPVKPSFTTLSGLQAFPSTGRWETKIIPLSHTKFLILNITGSGYTGSLDPLAATIVEPNAIVSDAAISAAVKAEAKDDELATDPQGTIGLYSLSSFSGPTGTNVTLTGKGFLKKPSLALQQQATDYQKEFPVEVEILGNNKGTTLWAGIPSSDSQITVNIPARACSYLVLPGQTCKSYTIFTPGQYQIWVRVYGQQETSRFQFTITGPAISDVPKITSISPTSGPVGTKVTVHGVNFTGSEGINFGNIPLYPSVDSVSVDGTQLTFTIPAHDQYDKHFPGTAYSISLSSSNGSIITTSETMFSLTN